MDSLREWLQAHGLAQHERLFVDNEVDLATLRVLTDDDLKELGLPFGPRKRILHLLRNTSGTATSTADVPAAPAVTGPSSEASERRQLTVLFCDMVGFTTLATRVDPEVLQEIIGRYETTCTACINRYDGYVFQRLGDGIVAFFGYPLAHEGEAERAIHAGRAIFDALANLEVPVVGRLDARIGIASGEVVVSPGYGAVGETMNVAARLQDRSTPGNIVVSERVHRLAGGAFEYEDLGELSLKGIARPMRAYRVARVSEAATRFDAATEGTLSPLVARELEIGLLMERWQSARDGEGQVVLVSGEPGIGKSRVLSTLRGRLEAQHVRALRYQCSPYHIHSAFYPIVDHLERALRIDRNTTNETKLAALESFMNARGRAASDIPLIANLLSISLDGRYEPLTLRGQRLKEETFRALVDLAVAIASHEPGVMLFEDLHWADPTTLEALDVLIHRASDLRLLLVLTHRPEFTPRWLAHGHVTAINLAKLTRGQCARLVTSAAHEKALPGELLEQIVERADGVPLFVEELTRAILESGDLVDAGDHYEVARASSGITIPPTLRDLLMARLDQESAVKEIAQVGAAIGRNFSYELISAIAPVTAEVLAEHLDRLLASGLAFRRGSIPHAQYTFKHALIQDAAYESMLKSRRQTLHGRIASVLVELFPTTVETEPELLARHFTAAGQEEAALPFWRRAGEHAMRRFAMSEAMAHLNHGLELTARMPEGRDRSVHELALRRLLGPAIVARKGWATTEVAEVLEPGWELARSLNDRDSFIPVLHGLWVNALTRGDLARALAWAEQMLAVPGAPDDDLRLSGHRAALASHFWLGDLVAAKRHGDAIREIYDFDRHGHIAALTNSDPLTAEGTYRGQYLWMLGHPDEAIRTTHENHAHARKRGHPFDTGFALTLGSGALDFCNMPEALEADAEEAIAVGKEHGIPVMSDVLAEITLAIAGLLRGAFAVAIPRLDEGIRRLNATGQLIWGPYLRALVADARAREGDPESGLALIDEALADVDLRGERSHAAEILRLRAEILALMGRRDEALDVAALALEQALSQQAMSWALRAAMTLARFHVSNGDLAMARNVLAPIYGRFTEGHGTHDLIEAKRLLDELGN